MVRCRWRCRWRRWRRHHPVVLLLVLISAFDTAADAVVDDEQHHHPPFRELQSFRETVPLHGLSTCPCLRQGDLDPVSYNDLVSPATWMLGSDVNYAIYGFGCRQHDTEQPVQDCQKAPSERPSWCEKQWCWIDPDDCNVFQARSPSYHTQIRFYSYATCRDLDFFSEDTRVKSLNGLTLKVGLTQNTGGWIGGYSRLGENFEGTLDDWYGPAVEFGKVAAQLGNFTLVPTAPPDFLKDRSYDFFGRSTFDYCVYATTLGYLDLCISGFSASTPRITVSDFYLVDKRDIYIIAQSDLEGNDSVSTIFAAFEFSAWIFIVFVTIPIMGALVVVHERGAPGGIFPLKHNLIVTDHLTGEQTVQETTAPVLKQILRSVHFTLLGTLAAFFPQRVVTLGGKIHVIGVSFFILTFISVYTANLSAILVNQSNEAPFDGLEDIYYRGYKVCAIRNVMAMVQQIHENVPDNIFLKDPEDALPGFNCPSCQSRRRVFDFMDADLADLDERYCHVSIAYGEDLLMEQAEGRHCNKTVIATNGQPLATSAWGFPLSRRISNSISTLLHMLQNDAVFESILLRDEPTRKCRVLATSSTVEGVGMTVTTLTGIWSVSFAFAILGLFATFLLPCLRRRIRRNHTWKAKPILRHDQNGEIINSLRRQDSFLFRGGRMLTAAEYFRGRDLRKHKDCVPQELRGYKVRPLLSLDPLGDHTGNTETSSTLWSSHRYQSDRQSLSSGSSCELIRRGRIV